MDLKDFQYSESILIDAPAHHVYDLVTDVTRTGEWSPIVETCWWKEPSDHAEWLSDKAYMHWHCDQQTNAIAYMQAATYLLVTSASCIGAWILGDWIHSLRPEAAA